MDIEPLKVICINDKNIPSQIPIELHVIDGEIYTAVGIEHLLSSAVIGFRIEEKPLGEECFPYHYWGAHRFAEYTPEMESLSSEIKEMIKHDKIHAA